MKNLPIPLLPLALASLLAGCTSSGPQPTSYSTNRLASLPRALEDSATAPHQITLDGTALNYLAAAGHLTAISPQGDSQAAIFYTAYTAAGQDPAQRPLTFLYNGGPGSSSIWLHLGGFGPKRLATGDPDPATPTPFPLVDSSESLLDVTDLVFVDPVGTGLSEAIAPYVNGMFWGVDPDAAVLRDFIRRYLEVNGRQGSPIYLFGESYGTPRTAVLANLLLEARVNLAGVVLQSSILDYNSNGGTAAHATCAGYLPSYAAVGAWFSLCDPAPADLADFLGEVREFTDTSYNPAADAWLQAGTAPAPALTAQLEADTGIASALWQAEFNLLPDDYRLHLLPGILIGRYDARVSAPSGSPLARAGDPSSSYLEASFASSIQSYLADFVGYPGAGAYAAGSDAADSWDFSHDGQDLPDTVPDLAAALARNPALKVLSVNGYHDLATPFHQTELDLARLGGHPGLALRYYPGGHMTYLDDHSRPLEKADLAAFYQGAPAAAAAPSGPAAPAQAPAPSAGPLPLLAVAADPAAPHRVPLLRDPYVPPGRRRPAAMPPTRGEDLRRQVERKLHPPTPE